MNDPQNPVGLEGIDFVELASENPDALHRLLLAFGFSRTMRHAERAVDLYRQGSITFLLNRDAKSFAAGFEKAHGPCVASMGWRVHDSAQALAVATARGAEASTDGDYPAPAIRGIGDSRLYFVDARLGPRRWGQLGFVPLERPDLVPSKGFLAIDHLTNNVEKGTLGRWAAFYKEVFAFTEVRYFDIRGVKTGLTSYALRSPDGSFAIPINEGTDAKSQINEYLEEYRGPGVQHLAFSTDDILGSLDALAGTGIGFLDIEDEYYRDVFTRVPRVREDHARIQRHNVLVDGDEDGYLLQIFTRNVIGPIFIELIQRHNHRSFGEGNFGALFRSIERDQMKRGYLAP